MPYEDSRENTSVSDSDSSRSRRFAGPGAHMPRSAPAYYPTYLTLLVR